MNEENNTLKSLAEIAAYFISEKPECDVNYQGIVGSPSGVLTVRRTGYYLRDIRPFLSDDIECDYGMSQDSILFYIPNK